MATLTDKEIRARTGFNDPKLPPSQVFVTTEDNTQWFIARFAEDAPVAAAALGWEAVARQRRRPITVWRGVGEMTLTLSLEFDAYRSGGSIEGLCRAVEVMAGAFVGGDPEPPKLIVFGKAVPHSAALAPQSRWVIQELAWDEAIRDSNTGQRMRQKFTLTLLLHTEAKKLEKVAPRKSAPTYKVKLARKGDTYEKLAARELGNKRHGRKLAQLNGDRDPTKKLKTGQQVRMPSAKLLAKWKRELR
jgi:hypothetical protein